MDRWLREGKIPEPNPYLAADMYEYACESLAKSGYHHYEIANWSRAGRACRHNLVYWENGPYLGVGPGAHSRLGNYRFWTVLSPREYNIRSANWSESDTVSVPEILEVVLEGIPTLGGWEHISTETACSETMFLGLRLLDGLDIVETSVKSGLNLIERFETPIQECIDLGLLERDGNCLKLTSSSYLIANQAFTRFLE